MAGGEFTILFFSIQPGSDTDVQISPSFTTTSDGALTQFNGDERECYTCDEVTFINDF